MRYVIIGGGIAGTTAAEELRKLDVDAEITIVSEEFHALYSRVLLPHFLKGKVPRERVFLKKESWYQEQNIEWLTGVSVMEIDASNQHVVLSNQQTLPYDKLLLATGGDVQLTEEDKEGVCYFRTLDDADQIHARMQLLAHNDPVAIYGGGFIACEFLNLFAHAGFQTTLIFRGAHMWSRTISAEAGRVLHQHIERHGVKIITNAQEPILCGEKHVESLEVQDTTIPCKLLGVGMGIQSNMSLFSESGLEMQNGILCNSYLETNLPNVFTAGDVTEFYDERLGRSLMTGNWMSAQTQGRVVAKNMHGEKLPFDLVSSYATNALGLEIIFIGDTSRSHADELFILPGADETGVAEVFVRAGCVVGAILVGRNQDRARLTLAIKEKQKKTSLF